MVGEPSKPGPYLIRVKVPHGVKLMPHKHPEDRIYTVMSGVFYIGLGEQFDDNKVKAYPPRWSVIVLPGNTSHFPLGEVGRVRHASVGDRPSGSRLSGPGRRSARTHVPSETTIEKATTRIPQSPLRAPPTVEADEPVERDRAGAEGGDDRKRHRRPVQNGSSLQPSG